VQQSAVCRLAKKWIPRISDNQKLLFNPAKVFMKILHEFFMPSTLPLKPWRVSGAEFAKSPNEQGLTHGNDH
jgi:hypothetical protein